VNAIFADTSYYVAWLSPRDEHHVRAVELSENNRAMIVTTELIVVELVNFFSKTAGRSIVADFVRSLRNDPDTRILPASDDFIARGFELFSKRPDKEWSLTDCISFVVMEEYGILEALTSDADFEQAGFQALLR
jgi:uncharacterized protein